VRGRTRSRRRTVTPPATSRRTLPFPPDPELSAAGDAVPEPLVGERDLDRGLVAVVAGGEEPIERVGIEDVGQRIEGERIDVANERDGVDDDRRRRLLVRIELVLEDVPPGVPAVRDGRAGRGRYVQRGDDLD
jgi:hypothetical protein